MKSAVVVATLGASVILGTAGCSSVSDSAVAPTTGVPAVNNVVYFGNPIDHVQYLGDYVISGTGTSADGQPFIDTVVLFAANINNKGGQPPTSPSMQAPVLDFLDSNLGGPTGPPPVEPRDVSGIAPAINALHNKGIKVLLGILPNHQGTGWSCPGMTDAAQQSLADQIATATSLAPTGYGFDGISIDDEYSECPAKNYDPGGDASVNVGIVSKLSAEPAFTRNNKRLLITKSVYSDSFVFPQATTPPPTPNTTSLAPLLDQAWTEVYPSSYGDLYTYQQAGLTNPQLGLSTQPSVSVPVGQGTPAEIAASVVSHGLGAMMVWGTDSTSNAAHVNIPYTPAQRASWYSSVVQGEFGNTKASVTYTGPAPSAAKK